MKAATHSCTLRGNEFPDIIFPYHNVQPKLKAQAVFVRKSVVLCPILYIYHDEMRRDYLMEYLTETVGHCTYGEIVQVMKVRKNIIQYRIEYDATKAVGGGIGFCGLCTECPTIAPVKYILRRSVYIHHIIEQIFNEGNKGRIRINNNKIRIDPNHNQENDLGEASATTKRQTRWGWKHHNRWHWINISC